LAQADRIDPAIGGAFLTAMKDENNTTVFNDGQGSALRFPTDKP